MIRILTAVLLFEAAASVTAVLAAMAVGSLTVYVSAAALCAGTAAAAAGWRSVKDMKTGMGRPTVFDFAVFFLFTLFCLRHFLWIYFYKDGEIYTLNQRHNYSDLSLHLSYIANFLNGTRFWPENPVLTGEPLTYHIGMDLFTALWAKLGFSLYQVLPVIGLAGGLLTMCALYLWGRGFAVAGFLFAGGMAGFLFFTTGSFEDYQADVAWKSLPLTLLVPQRGYLFGFPAGLLLLWSWRRRFLKNGEPPLPSWIEGFIWGSLPLFHINTFAFLSLIFFIWAVFSKRIKEAMGVYYAAVLPAAFFILILTDKFDLPASLLWISPFWMADDQNPLFFLLINFGLFLPCFLFALSRALLDKSREFILMCLPSFVLFTFFLFVMVMPHPWDNIKYLVWCYLLALPAIDHYVISPSRWYLRAALCLLLFLSGFVSLFGSMKAEMRGASFADTEELDYVCGMLEDVPQKERIAAAQVFNHPVLFCGHMIVAGWKGHLWSHGHETAPIEHKLNRVLQGEFDWRLLARELGAKYIFWGGYEKADFPDSNLPWKALSYKVAENKWGELYRIDEPAVHTPAGPLLAAEPGEGLKAVYFPNENWSGRPVKEEYVKAAFFSWENEEDRLYKDPFSAVYEGEIHFPESGDYEIYLASDDGSRLILGSEVIIENMGIHEVRVRSHRAHYNKDVYPIKIEYHDAGGGAYLKLWWKTPSGREELIQSPALRGSE